MASYSYIYMIIKHIMSDEYISIRQEFTDHRQEIKVCHLSTDIIFITVAAVVVIAIKLISLC